MLLDEIAKRWDDREIPAHRTPDGQVWARADYFQQAMEDIGSLLDLCAASVKSRTNAERKARKARKKLKASPGDTLVKDVTEKGLRRSVGPNVSTASSRGATQSQSVSKALAPANGAEGRGTAR